MMQSNSNFKQFIDSFLYLQKLYQYNFTSNETTTLVTLKCPSLTNPKKKLADFISLLKIKYGIPQFKYFAVVDFNSAVDDLSNGVYIHLVTDVDLENTNSNIHSDNYSYLINKVPTIEMQSLFFNTAFANSNHTELYEDILFDVNLKYPIDYEYKLPQINNECCKF